MGEIYTRINQLASEQVYTFMKEKEISPLSYHFSDFFDECLDKYNIKLMEHHFSNQQIEGLTLIDDYGISFSYERDNPEVKQNFTKCHELGHFFLGHSGSFFIELKDQSDSKQETEANIFSAIILMPAIVLLSKIFYRHDSFQRVMKDLSVSAEALKFRLLDIFRFYTDEKYDAILRSISAYQRGVVNGALKFFDEIKEKIISKYEEIKIDVTKMILKKVEETGFVTSLDFEELLDWNFCKVLTGKNQNLGAWKEFNKGKVISYIWKKDKFNKEGARRKVNILF
ncbi:ImmA/IrrE family metallo-endopeptidase [Streptococcus thermophilus]|nr:ImmA/IrrE family metallo-endopeptidase [Streptococcus thermophilus]MCE2100041.1 ImmA/IrrE family metallo-endopeptidase [Streptococcus thermophilus]